MKKTVNQPMNDFLTQLNQWRNPQRMKRIPCAHPARAWNALHSWSLPPL